MHPRLEEVDISERGLGIYRQIVETLLLQASPGCSSMNPWPTVVPDSGVLQRPATIEPGSLSVDGLCLDTWGFRVLLFHRVMRGVVARLSIWLRRLHPLYLRRWIQLCQARQI